MSIYAQGQPITFFLWFDESDQSLSYPELRYSHCKHIDSGDSSHLKAAMKKESDVVIQPKDKSSSADIYAKFGKQLGLAIQAKNGNQKLTWTSIAQELSKMGTFKTKMYYIIGSMTYPNKKLTTMMNSEGFIKLPFGKYYFQYNNDENVLLREFQVNENSVAFQLYSINGTVTQVERVHKRTRLTLSLGPYYLLSKLHPIHQLTFSPEYFFSVPNNSYLIVLGKQTMIDFITEETYNIIETQWVCPSKDPRKYVPAATYLQSLARTLNPAVVLGKRKAQSYNSQEEPSFKRFRASKDDKGREEKKKFVRVLFNDSEELPQKRRRIQGSETAEISHVTKAKKIKVKFQSRTKLILIRFNLTLANLKEEVARKFGIDDKDSFFLVEEAEQYEIDEDEIVELLQDRI